jgi:hypothetical protein
MKGVTFIESFSRMKKGDPLGDFLFVLAHYQVLLKTITRAFNYVFPSLTNDTQIAGPMSEITHTFDHLSTQLTLVWLRVKVLKYKLWNPSRIFLRIKIIQGCTLVIDGLCVLGVLMGSQDFATLILDEVLSLGVTHINDLPFLGDAQVVLDVLFSCITHRPSYLTQIIHLFFSSFLSFLVGFDRLFSSFQCSRSTCIFDGHPP